MKEIFEDLVRNSNPKKYHRTTRCGMATGRSHSSGFTLLEVLMTLLVASILLGIGIPSFNELRERQNVKGMAEQVASHVGLVRSEAISRSANTAFRFSATGSGAYGLSTVLNCDPDDNLAGTNPCILVVDDGLNGLDPGDGTVDTNDLVLNRFDTSSYPSTSLSFTPNTNAIVFDSVRGVATNTGSITVTSNASPTTYQLRVDVGILGDVSICNLNNMTGYANC